MLKQKLIVEHVLAKSGKDFQDTLTVPFENIKRLKKDCFIFMSFLSYISCKINLLYSFASGSSAFRLLKSIAITL